MYEFTSARNAGEGKTLSRIAKIRSRSLSNSTLSQGERTAKCTLAPCGRGKIFLANAVSLENWVRGNDSAIADRASLVRNDEKQQTVKTLVPQYLSALVPFKKAAFTLAEGATHVAQPKNVGKAAFTLAEVLITLGIVGVVAAMTMPTLVAHYKEKQTVVALKKFYSTLEQAIRLYQIDNPEDYSSKNITSLFKTVKVCQPGDKSCAIMQYKKLNGNSEGVWGKQDNFSDTMYYAILIDGSIIRYFNHKQSPVVRGTSEALKNVYGEFSIDINGNKPPNQMGRDVFFFHITKYGVVPSGTKDEDHNYTSFINACKNKSSADGKGCTAWVLFNENMDYMHCSDLDWETKTKCK